MHGLLEMFVLISECFIIFTMPVQTPEILKSLEAMQTREVQSILIDHESLNVIIRLAFFSLCTWISTVKTLTCLRVSI